MAANPSEPLLDKTHRLLGARGVLTLKQISEESGVDESWLAKFHRGAIPKPGVIIVQQLHDYLVAKIGDEAVQ
jgi:hypothetical protein